MNIRSLCVAMLLLFFCGCQKELSLENYQTLNTANENIASPVKASVAGLIVDENNKPLPGVSVSSGGSILITNARGYFRFNNIQLDKYVSLVTAEMNGYFKGYRIFTAKQGGVHFIKIQLLPKKSAGSLASTTGGSITFQNTTIVFPSDGYVYKSNGQAYNGTVKIFATEIDPTANNIDEIVPGNFVGIDSSNKRVLLRSFGMLNVELESNTGDALQLAPSKTATIKQQIPSSLLSSAKNVIPMWYVDDKDGLWKQDGVATRNGNSYEGKVSHFTPWNFDVPFGYAGISLKLIDSSKNILQHIAVKFTGTSSGVNYRSYSDTSGYVAVFVPVGEIVQMEVISDKCGTPLFSMTMGPYNTNIDLGEIVLPIKDVLVKGKVLNCSGIAVSSGGVQVYFEDKYFNTTIDNNGNFSIALLQCQLNPQMELQAIDAVANQVGPIKYLRVGIDTFTNIILSACGTPLNPNNTVYVLGGDYKLYAYDISSGNVKWVFQTNATNLSGCTPVIANNVLYYVENTNNLLAIDCATGTLKWQHAFSTYSNGNAFVYNSKVYSYDNTNGKLYALNATDGSPVWERYLGGTQQVILASPKVSNGIMIYPTQSDSTLYGLDPETGTIHYKKNFPITGTFRTVNVTSNKAYTGIFGTLLYTDINGNQYYSQGGIASVNPATGDTLAVDYLPTETNVETPVVKNDVAYTVVDNGKSLYAFDLLNKTIKWRNYYSGSGIPFRSAVLIDGNNLYSSLDNKVYCYDINSGATKWSTILPNETAIFCSVISNGVLYTKTSKGNFYALDAPGGSIKWAKTFAVSSISNSTPVVIDNNGNVINASTSPMF